jgi:uncharacterized protein with HEPN domain
MKQDRAYLQYILQCIRKIEEDVKRRPKAAHPDIEWASIAGLRNVLVHAYFDVDLEVVWGCAS